MKKILGLVMSSIIFVSITVTSVSADPQRGQKLYLKKLKKDCGLKCSQMSAKHTKDQWLELKDSDKLEDEIKRICPKVKDVKDKYLPHMFDFFYKFGSDSGNIPSC